MSPALKVGDICSIHAAESFQRNQLIAFHPPAKFRFDNPEVLYISRLVGLPGDSLGMKAGHLILNGKEFPFLIETKLSYLVETSMVLNENRIKGMDYNLSRHDQRIEYTFYATPGEITTLKENGAVTRITPLIDTLLYNSSFPIIFNGKSVDTWGSLRVPKKGDEITITEENLHTLEQLISEYENAKIPSLGEAYTFQKDYYFVISDNRHNALDSRYFGFIPEDQLEGVAVKH